MSDSLKKKNSNWGSDFKIWRHLVLSLQINWENKNKNDKNNSFLIQVKSKRGVRLIVKSCQKNPALPSLNRHSFQTSISFIVGLPILSLSSPFFGLPSFLLLSPLGKWPSRPSCLFCCSPFRHFSVFPWPTKQTARCCNEEREGGRNRNEMRTSNSNTILSSANVSLVSWLYVRRSVSINCFPSAKGKKS